MKIDIQVHVHESEPMADQGIDDGEVQMCGIAREHRDGCINGWCKLSNNYIQCGILNQGEQVRILNSPRGLFLDFTCTL